LGVANIKKPKQTARSFVIISHKE